MVVKIKGVATSPFFIFNTYFSQTTAMDGGREGAW
jgi:hypothetical protein